MNDPASEAMDTEWPDDTAALQHAKELSYELSHNASKLVEVRVYRENGERVLEAQAGLVIGIDLPPPDNTQH